MNVLDALSTTALETTCLALGSLKPKSTEVRLKQNKVTSKNYLRVSLAVEPFERAATAHCQG